uniref:Crossover suppressor on 2 of manheim n=2 Tax=Drosophila melanogaster TaxID=7227 RepID=Q9VJL5_DROME|nr:crossover suppressor on 2 of manheim [Drosophila melanogaster]AAF53518.2 crossover suppressor on 2 of manheim [Drosophila melanogaster]AAL28402.1 GM03132p [Drosophila melanogaster]|eukprot:NP_609788.1 crossover suppressor on 2 of manheim [Drosophila melanogaster]
MSLNLYESNILNSCWKAGGRKPRKSAFGQLNRNEIADVDVVACCKQITELIEENALRKRQKRSNVLAARNRQNVIFKDISRLVFGVADIFRCQVDLLLGDTKVLLDQCTRTNLDYVLTTTKSVVVNKSEIRIQRKGKRVITKKSKVTVSKRPRLQESDLLDEFSHEYYEKMLSECQMWQTECTQQVVEDLNESIEQPRSCTQSKSYHSITITEEIELPEDHSLIMPSNGFGEAEGADLTIFQELYPKDGTRNSLKRHSIAQDPTDILPDKMPRLDDCDVFQADNAIMTQIFPHNIEPAEVTQIVCEPSLPSVLNSFGEITFSHPKNRKRKLIVDKRIEYTREQLVKHRQKYMEEYLSRNVIVPKSSDLRKPPKELLCKLYNNVSFLALHNHSGPKLSNEEKEFEAENTLRTIFGCEFTENLSKEIFVRPSQATKCRDKAAHIYQPEPLEVEDCVQPQLQPRDDVNQNYHNEMNEHGIYREDNHDDTYSVMMSLLSIWRNNPKITGIDAIDFIKTFDSRIKASLAFLHLLYLVRDHFIEISKRANSLEMYQITLGKESAKLIDNLMLSETL